MPTARLAAAGDPASEFLPHTPPFLLLDRIVAIDGPTGRFVKHVTAADPLLGPSGELSPILLVEAMALERTPGLHPLFQIKSTQQAAGAAPAVPAAAAHGIGVDEVHFDLSFDLIDTGSNAMPPFADALSKEEKENVVAYLKTL